MKNEGKKIDFLAFGAHPDDVEACAGGLLLIAKKAGHTTGIVDLTRGEASNFGSVEERNKEARKAARILKLDLRMNLSLPDADIPVDESNVVRLVEVIREYRPEVVLLPYFADLHPAHASVGLIGEKAVFFAKIAKFAADLKLPPHQVSLSLFYMLHTEFTPSFALDISDVYPIKKKALLAHRSQFYLKKGDHYTPKFHNPDFLEFFEARAKVYGYKIGCQFAEPYLLKGIVGLKNLDSLTSGGMRSLTGWQSKKE